MYFLFDSKTIPWFKDIKEKIFTNPLTGPLSLNPGKQDLTRIGSS